MSQLPPGPPPPPGAQGPPSQPPGYGGYGGPPPPGAPPPGYGGYGGPPPPGGPPPSGGYGAPPPSGGRSKGPLIAILAVVVVLVLVAAAGLVFALTRGGDGTADLTASEMRGALLDEDDVGNGFVEDSSDDDEDEDSTDLDDIDADAECLDLLEELEDEDNVVFDSTTDPDGEDVPKAEVSFSNEDDDTDLDQEITVDANDALDDARRVTEICGEIELDDGESVGQIEYALGDPIDVGDESLTLELSLALEEPFAVEVEFTGVLWVRDGILSSLLLTGALDDDLESTPPDRDLLEELAVEADEKLQQVIDEDG